MKEEVIIHQKDPKKLEELYRADKKTFTTAIHELYASNPATLLYSFWYERLFFTSTKPVSSIPKVPILLTIGLCFITSFLIKLPALTDITEDVYYGNAIPFLLIIPLIIFYNVLNNANKIKWVITITIPLALLLFISTLPFKDASDSVILSRLHTPLLLWSILGVAYLPGTSFKTAASRIQYLQMNADLVITTGLILIAGGFMTGISLFLFNSIDLDINSFYMKWIVVIGSVSAPLVATHVINQYPNIINNVSPVIAKIFSPLALITLSIFVVSAILNASNLCHNRDELLIYNIVLLSVLGLVLFSTVESDKQPSNFNLTVSLLLVTVTVALDIIVLYAISYRISEWGFSPNRLAVIGSNLLVLIHLGLIGISIGKTLYAGQTEGQQVRETIGVFLPVYTCWTIVVIFLFPLIEGIS